MQVKFQVCFYGLNHCLIKTSILSIKPSFSKLNRMANKVAISYGAHPSIEVNEILK